MPRPCNVNRNISSARMLPRQSLVMGAQQQRKTSSTIRASITRERSITFCETHRYHQVECLDDLPQDEILSIWFTPEECSAMKHDAYCCAAAVDAGHEDADGRGLECQTEQGAWLSYKARKDAYNVVLGEIEDQQARGRPVDWDKIARLYAEESANSYREAAIRGKKDEEEAKRLHAEQQEENSRASSTSQCSIPSLEGSAVSDDSQNESESMDLKKEIKETRPVNNNKNNKNKAATPVAPPRQPSFAASVETNSTVDVVEFAADFELSDAESSDSDDDDDASSTTSSSSSASSSSSCSTSSSSTVPSDDDSDTDSDDSDAINAAVARVAAKTSRPSVVVVKPPPVVVRGPKTSTAEERKARLKKVGFDELKHSSHKCPRRFSSAVADAQAKTKKSAKK